MKAISIRRSAAVACVLVLALVVGPSCAGLCAGAACAVRDANHNRESSCHHMAYEHGDQFAPGAGGNVCGAADASLAVAGRPTLTVERETAASGNAFAGIAPILASPNSANSGMLLSSGGQSPGSCETEPPFQILRV